VYYVGLLAGHNDYKVYMWFSLPGVVLPASVQRPLTGPLISDDLALKEKSPMRQGQKIELSAGLACRLL